MKAWTKFKLIILTPVRIIRIFFNFVFPQVITMQCKTCGELMDVDKYIFIEIREAKRKNKKLEPHLELDCPFCHQTKFQLSKKKRSRKFKPYQLIKRTVGYIFTSILNMVIFISGNIFAEIWKVIIRFWRDDFYSYLKTIISFVGICVGAVILGYLLGLDIIVSFALTLGFFMINVLKNITRRK